MSFWTEVRGKVVLPKNANFSIAKSFKEKSWEGHINVKKVEEDNNCYIVTVSFVVRLDCYELCIGLNKWVKTFPKGSKVEFEIEGQYAVR